MAYFERIGASTFRATPHVGGAWDTAEQHIAPALGLLAHVVELDRDARRSDGLVLARTATDGAGQVTFADLPPGRYLLTASRPGFVPRESSAFDVRRRAGLVGRIGARMGSAA